MHYIYIVMFKVKEEEIDNAHAYFRKLESIYFLFISIPLSVFVYTYFTNNKPNQLPPQPMDLPDWLVIFLVAGSTLLILLTHNKFKKQLKQINDTVEGTKPKMVAYFTVNVRFYFLIEMIALFWTLMYWGTHINVFAVLFGLHIAYISIQRNTAQRLGQHLKFPKSLYDKIRKGEEL